MLFALSIALSLSPPSLYMYTYIKEQLIWNDQIHIYDLWYMIYKNRIQQISIHLSIYMYMYISLNKKSLKKWRHLIHCNICYSQKNTYCNFRIPGNGNSARSARMQHLAVTNDITRIMRTLITFITCCHNRTIVSVTC